MAQPIKIETPFISSLQTRARAEYLEMPGLCLTLPQAARLFALDRDACATLLDGLVIEGFLHRIGERYARINVGRQVA